MFKKFELISILQKYVSICNATCTANQLKTGRTSGQRRKSFRRSGRSGRRTWSADRGGGGRRCRRTKNEQDKSNKSVMKHENKRLSLVCDLNGSDCKLKAFPLIFPESAYFFNTLFYLFVPLTLTHLTQTY